MKIKMSNDKTAWEQYREENPGNVGTQLYGFIKLVLTMMVGFLLLVFVSVKLGDVMMVHKSREMAMLWVGAVTVLIVLFFRHFDKQSKRKGVKRIEK